MPTVEAAVRQPLACLLADEIDRTLFLSFQLSSLGYLDLGRPVRLELAAVVSAVVLLVAMGTPRALHVCHLHGASCE